jgi:hypothetical protein
MHYLTTRSAIVSSETTYIAGHELDKHGTPIPTLRKNGALEPLSGQNTKNAVVNSVFVK